MDYKKSKAPVNTVTRNIMDLCEDTGNIYESVAIISKRANQISLQIKDDLSKKLAEFASYNDSLEEVFENREQIEISRYYEKLPKPSLLATQEFIEDKIYWRDPSRDAQDRTTCSVWRPVYRWHADSSIRCRAGLADGGRWQRIYIRHREILLAPSRDCLFGIWSSATSTTSSSIV